MVTWFYDVATGVSATISLDDFHGLAKNGHGVGVDQLPTVFYGSGHDMSISGHDVGVCQVDLDR